MKNPRPYFEEIKCVDFSLLCSDEIRKISVKQIVNPNVFDELNNPTIDGPCTPMLGPMKKNERCLTCGMGWLTCPGHFGHIELPSYFYNPITFKLVLRLLDASCVYCYKFRIMPLHSKILGSKILLLRTGNVAQIGELDDIVSNSSGENKLKDNGIDSCNEDEGNSFVGAEEDVFTADKNNLTSSYTREITQKIDTYIKSVLGYTFPPNSNSIIRDLSANNIHVTRAIIDIEKNFLKSVPQVCPNCEMYNPKYYEFRDLKIFQKPIPPKHYRDAILKGYNISDTLYGPLTGNYNKTCTGIIDEIKDDEECVTSNTYLDSEKVYRRLKRVCENEKDLFSLMYGAYNSKKFNYNISANDLFLDVICVTPNAFRPFSKLFDKVFVHPQNVVLCDILKDIYNIQIACSVTGNEGNEENNHSDSKKRMMEVIDAIIKLQYDINMLYDSSKAYSSKKAKTPPGIRQVLEKKEGLIRKHMMGKRVNYSARSVISPDPNIDCNEIGLPYVFATRLTYTESVTFFNAERLRKAVINGPFKWPGATHVQIDNNTLLSLEMYDEMGRKSIAGQLLTPTESGILPIQQKVHRHILNGDFVLFNRQPTLHKPSIMCHTARILPNEKTIRLNYVNCNTYNADFDGDEMNVHFPQDEVSRAEAMLIARTSEQYLGPANGDVLRGLVQDHVCSGVLMCSKGVFFNRKEYVQLVYDSLRPEKDLRLEEGDHKIEHCNMTKNQGRISLLAPAIISPIQRWTGKQVISTVILNTLGGLLPLNMTSKVSLSAKQIEMYDPEDLYVNFIDGEMLTGYMDKSQLGAKTYGTMHSIYELYGSYFSEKLLSSLSRLFTAFLQSVGFSCRLKDLRLDEEGDEIRKEIIDKSKTVGLTVLKDFLTDYGYNYFSDEKQGLENYETIENVIKISKDASKHLDFETRMKASSNQFTSKIISACIPSNLLVPFPMNSMQVMTLSGAKGSTINAAQISVLLGQQELEGKRVPTMLSGKTLPSFVPYDTSIRAGGFISDRFLTGIRPQEYYFHCMAGREGLIDTAVKTSRSGYLQRCLIKHLEDIKVEYDNTVRNSNGSVIQFAYGEDSLDVSKSKSLFNFDFCALNYKSYLSRYDLPRLVNSSIDTSSVKKYIKKMKKNNMEMDVLLNRFEPSRYIGAVSELFQDELTNYIEKNPLGLLHNSGETAKRNSILSSNFDLLMKLKYQMSLVVPGEAVGLLAAQSIGEPSTQMTLNTFHLAGFGAKNITLGVPRLQEVIMMALATSKTPIMKFNVNDSSEETAIYVCDQFSRLCLWDILEDLVIEEDIKSYEKPISLYCKRYVIKLKFLNEKVCLKRHGITRDEINKFLKHRFLPLIFNHVNREIKKSSKRYFPTTFMSAHTKSTEATGNGQEIDDADIFCDVDDTDMGLSKNSNDGTSGNTASMSTETKNSKKLKSAQNYPFENALADVEHSDSESSIGSNILEDAKTELKIYIKKEHENATFIDQTITDHSKTELKENDLMLEPESLNGEFNSEESFNYPRYISGYKFPVFETSGSISCHVEMELSIETKILIMSTIESVCKKAIIRQVEGVNKCLVTPKDSEMQKTVSVTADGVNLKKVWELNDLVDCNTIYTNEISAVLSTYGVEAARAAIVSEIKNVFSAYGINVSYRHLSLIADYMTFQGGQCPLNRVGIITCPSPLSKMSFETTFSFLKNATLLAEYDDLKTPSSCIMIGKHAPLGTGIFDVVCPIKSS